MKVSTIDEYLSTLSPETQVILERIRQTIRRVVPQAEETISYDMPMFDLHGKHLIFFAAWKRHISFYLLPEGGETLRRVMGGV